MPHKPRKSNATHTSLQKIPIAIIGMAGIFPQAKDLREYWDNIINEVDCITDVPPTRWNIEDYYDPDPQVPDKTYCKRGGFIPDIDFNPMDFGLPPNILELTDVSQLLSLVVAKRAMADAGYSAADEATRSRTGVILGVGGGQKLITPLTTRLQYPIWDKVLESSGIPASDRDKIIEKMKLAYIRWEENSFPGMLGNVIAGRIANRLDLGGINCVVDAACAASLAAVKMAVSELIEGKCNAMITGGVDTDNSIFMYMSFSKTPAFSKSQNIRPFDAKADGMMIGEGVGMMVLKRLADAERDKDRIYAVIKGVGTSSDGRYKSIYAPRSSGQAEATGRAYQEADFEPSTVGLVEAHGTGTAAGDPTEFAGLNEVFSRGNTQKQYIALGSVKSQIGHTKAAAGAASLIKTALALHHKVLPPTINITEPNPKFDIENSPFYLNTTTRPWMAGQDALPRRAGVSSFGFGGTNFHFVLEEYDTDHTGAYRVHTTLQEILIAAESPEKLNARCKKQLALLTSESGEQHLAQLISDSRNLELSDRDARLGFVGVSLDQTVESLQISSEILSKDEEKESWEHPKGIHYRRRGVPTEGKIVALFPGQGSQYLEMGKDVAINFPSMRQSYALIDKLFAAEQQQTLSSVVFPAPTFDTEARTAQINLLRQTQFAQPAIGLFSFCLYKILSQAGFSPDFVAGHSFGEVTALWAAGVLDDETYFFLIKARGQAMASPQLPDFDAGTMIAVQGNAEQLHREVEKIEGVTIANLNTKSQTVLGGPKPAIQDALEYLKTKGFVVTPLPVSAAFHTSLVGHACEPFAQAVQGCRFKKPAIPVYANSTGLAYPSHPASIKKLLKEHILNPVRFQQQIENIYAAGGAVFIEVGPKTILTNLVKEILGDRPHVAVALNASHDKDSDLQLRKAYVKLRVAGLALGPLDPYGKLPETSRLGNGKHDGMTVKLNGNNYVSPKTKTEFAAALQDGHQIANGKSDQRASLSSGTPEPAASLSSPPSTTAATGDATSGTGTTRLQHSSPKPESVSQPAGKAPQPVPSTTQAQSPAPIHADPSVEPSRTGAQPDQAHLASLDHSLALLHEQQAETLRVHEQYLKIQEQYASGVFELMQQFHLGSPTQSKEDGSSNSQQVRSHQTTQATTPSVQPDPTTGGPVPKSDVRSGKLSPTLDGETTPLKYSSEPVQQSGQVAEARSLDPSTPPTAVGQPTATPPVTEDVTQAMLKVVSEKTGYPEETLELEMDMEADLGIDSIKRVEILGAMQDRYPDLPQVNPEELAELRTLAQIVERMQTASPGAPSVSPEQVTIPAPPASSGQNGTQVTPVEDITAAMLDVVSEKTGYPEETLDLDMDMEADLGIDSIKRVEILGAMQDRFPDLPHVNPEQLAEIRTLGGIVDYLGKSEPAVVGAIAGAQNGNNAPPAIPDHSITRNLVKLERLPVPDFLEFIPGDHPVCLLTDDGSAATSHLAKALRDEGWQVVVLRFPKYVVGKKSRLPESIKSVTLENLDESHLKQQLTAISSGFGPVGAFIHLQPKDQLIQRGNEGEADSTRSIIKSVFFLAKYLKASLTEAARNQRACFLTVSRLDGQLGFAHETEFDPVPGGLFGLTKTLNLEWSHVFCRALDLAPSLSAVQVAKYVIEELHDPNRLIIEIGRGVKGRTTLVANRGQNGNANPETEPQISSSSVFLVSGGAKGITAQCVIKLAHQYKCRFLLVGRSSISREDTDKFTNYQDEAGLKRSIMEELLERGEKPTPIQINKIARAITSSREIQTTLAAIREAGAQAEYLSADVTDASALQEKLPPAVERHGTITGIIHGAGVLSDKLIEQKSEKDFEAVYSTKVDGLNALLKCVPPHQLQHLVLFSSAAGFYGNVGQADYSLANEILNKTAQLIKNRHPDCHVVSINWGPWDSGMVTPGLRKLFAERNIEVIPVEVGASIFVNELAGGNADIAQTVIGGPLAVTNGVLLPTLRTHRLRRLLTLDANPFLNDHVIGDAPVLPTVNAIAWIANACEQLYPGYKMFCIDNYQVLKGIVFNGDNGGHAEYTLELEEVTKTNDTVLFKTVVGSVSRTGKERYHYRAQVTLLAQLPDAPLYENFDASEQHPIMSAELYQNGTLFHGPSFRGVERVLNISKEKVTMRCSLPPMAPSQQGQFRVQTFNPFIADGQYQSMVIWARHFHDAGSLPLLTKRGEQFRPIPFGRTTYVSMEVKESTDSKLVADIFTHDADGRIYSRVLGAEVTVSKKLNKLFAPSTKEAILT